MGDRTTNTVPAPPPFGVMDEATPTLETLEKAEKAGRGRYALAGSQISHRFDRVKLKR